MNRTQQLKYLNDKIRQLFHAGIDEQSTCEQLRSDSRFDSMLIRTIVHTFYKNLQKKADLESDLEMLQFRHERFVAEQDSLVKEHEYLEPFRENAEKFVYYHKNGPDVRDQLFDVWHRRFAVTLDNQSDEEDEEDDDEDAAIFHVFTLQDLFHGTISEVIAQRVGYLYGSFTLSNSFILFWESLPNKYAVRLMHYFLGDDTLRVVQTIERSNYITVRVDSSNTSKFILQHYAENDKYVVEMCELVRGKIEIVKVIEADWDNSDFDSYYDGQLLTFECNDYDQAKIEIRNLEKDTNKVVRLEQFPYHIYPADRFVDEDSHVWIRDRFFIPVRFQFTGDYSVAYADPHTRDWTTLLFSTNLPIRQIKFVGGQDLIIYTKNDLSEFERNDLVGTQQKFFKIPMRKPESLRRMAWMKLVEVFKKAKVQDPYAVARQYLPFNSELHAVNSINEE